jgi:hypothetical protein
VLILLLFGPSPSSADNYLYIPFEFHTEFAQLLSIAPRFRILIEYLVHSISPDSGSFKTLKCHNLYHLSQRLSNRLQQWGFMACYWNHLILRWEFDRRLLSLVAS